MIFFKMITDCGDLLLLKKEDVRWLTIEKSETGNGYKFEAFVKHQEWKGREDSELYPTMKAAIDAIKRLNPELCDELGSLLNIGETNHDCKS